MGYKNTDTQFSVLISIYNLDDPSFLKSSLDSLMEQTKIPSQVVLVIDGPINNLLIEQVNSFESRYLGIFNKVSLPVNVGLGLALKIGLECCTFDFVARMDSDDISFVNRFEDQLNYLINNPHISIIGSSVIEFENVPGDSRSIRKLPTVHDKIIKFSKFRNPINHPSVMFRKKDIIDIGSYSHMPLFEDYFLWVRAILNNKGIENLEKPLLYFRVGNNMVSRRSGFKYLIKEVSFLTKMYKLGFLNIFQLIINMLIKIPLRLLPVTILRIFYNNVLRNIHHNVK
ncbi:glycosyltransferase [Aquirufa antheringensis]